MAYTILSDDEKRTEYDQSGDLYDDDDMCANKSGVDQWTDYFSNLFPKVTTADIDAFEVKYKCSDEEEADVLKYYSQFKGDLNKMLECVMLSVDADKERWITDYINPAIESGSVKDYSDKMNKTMGSILPKKTKSRANKSKTKQVEEDDMSDSNDDTPCAVVVEDNDMETDDTVNNSSRKAKGKSSTTKASPKKKTTTKKASVQGKKKSSEDDLIAAIRGKQVARRQEGFDTMMAGLEERYGSKKKGQNRRVDDIPDDEFEKLQAKIMKNRKR